MAQGKRCGALEGIIAQRRSKKKKKKRERTRRTRVTWVGVDDTTASPTVKDPSALYCTHQASEREGILRNQSSNLLEIKFKNPFRYLKECGAVIKDTFTFHTSFTPLLYLYNSILCRDDHHPLLVGGPRRKYIPAKSFHGSFIHVCVHKNLGTCVMNIRAAPLQIPLGALGWLSLLF